jgi:hypothetical protein
VSYKELRLAEAVTMMKFDSTAELQEYVREKREDWITEREKLAVH